MKEDLIQIVQCPVTGDSLRYLTQDELKEINNRISKQNLQYFSGKTVLESLREGILSLNGKFAYEVKDDIALLLRQNAIMLDKDKVISGAQLCKEKVDVQDFYDSIGWKKNGEIFEDAKKFEDLRPVSRNYIHQCHMRVKTHLKNSGKYLLDVASGPIQYPEYLEYSKDYEFRVCVDISIVALYEAKEKLGAKGIYILGDITNLPFKKEVFDGVVSLHTIYHVPVEEQRKAFLEIYRVLISQSSAVVVYTWGIYSLPMSITTIPVMIPAIIVGQIKKYFQQSAVNGKALSKCSPTLYFKPHNYKWFIRNFTGVFQFEILVWRCVNVVFLKTYIKHYLFGRQILKVIYWLEEQMPHLMGRLGQYPLIIIRK